MKQLENHWKEFHEVLCKAALIEFVDSFQFWVKLDENNAHYVKTSVHFVVHHEKNYLFERNMFRTKFVEKNEACFMPSTIFP